MNTEDDREESSLDSHAGWAMGLPYAYTGLIYSEQFIMLRFWVI